MPDMRVNKPKAPRCTYRFVTVLWLMSVLAACVPCPPAAPSVGCPTSTGAVLAPTDLPAVAALTPTYTIYYPTPLPWDYTNRIAYIAPAKIFERNSLFEIVEYLVRQDLEQYKNHSMPEGRRIIDYKIEAIEILDDQNSKRFKKEHPANYVAIADIVMSVIPARYIYSDWFAGNGEYHPGDLWISRKSGYSAVIEKDGQYYLIHIGSSL
jgi:hypothetical protein